MTTTNSAMIAANLDRWNRAKITRQGFAPVAARLDAAKARYQTVEAKTKVPWQDISVTHEREASQNWNTQLGQGDPLSRVSTHVPKGRGPFKTWEDGAVDALMNCPPYAGRWTDWSIGGTLTILEKYNGVGYAARGKPSPYIWSGTDQYVSGKYVSDGVYDANAVDAQLGCAGLLLAMIAIDPSIKFGAPVANARPTPEPPKEIIDDATKGARKARTGAVAGAAGGGGNEITKTTATTEKPTTVPLLPSFVAYNMIGVAIVIAVLATVYIKHKTNKIFEIW